MQNSRLFQKDVAVGLLCLTIAAIGLIVNNSYPKGSASAMGPGFFPTMIFGLLGICGAGLTIWRLTRTGQGLGSWPWRPLATITLAMVVFGLVVEHLGFILSTMLLLLLSGASSPGGSWVRVLILAVVTSTVAGLLFVVLLNLQIPLWPRLS
jgi:putative tricarboxylic transport membrane protein